VSKDAARWDGAQANLCAYVDNDPVNGADFSGLQAGGMTGWGRFMRLVHLGDGMHIIEFLIHIALPLPDSPDLQREWEHNRRCSEAGIPPNNCCVDYVGRVTVCGLEECDPTIQCCYPECEPAPDPWCG
jgi:hypothetical protein